MLILELSLSVLYIVVCVFALVVGTFDILLTQSTSSQVALCMCAVLAEELENRGSS